MRINIRMATTTESFTPDLYDAYGELYPIISGLIMWGIVIALFIGCRHCCNKCSHKIIACSDRMSRIMANNRPCSYCWTHVDRTTEGSIDDRNDFSDPPEYSIAVDMPKPEHSTNQPSQSGDDRRQFTFANDGFQCESIVSGDHIPQNVDSDDIPVTLHRPETDPDLPSYDDALRSLSVSEDNTETHTEISMEQIDEEYDSDDTGLSMAVLDGRVRETIVTIEQLHTRTETSHSVSDNNNVTDTNAQIPVEHDGCGVLNKHDETDNNAISITVESTDVNSTVTSSVVPQYYNSNSLTIQRTNSSQRIEDMVELSSLNSLPSQASLTPVED